MNITCIVVRSITGADATIKLLWFEHKCKNVKHKIATYNLL